MPEPLGSDRNSSIYKEFQAYSTLHGMLVKSVVGCETH